MIGMVKDSGARVGWEDTLGCHQVEVGQLRDRSNQKRMKQWKMIGMGIRNRMEDKRRVET